MSSSLGALMLTVAATTAASACEPYTFGDQGFGLERGVQWAFVGRVVSEEANPELPGQPLSELLRVDRTVVGTAHAANLRVQQDAGCDGFWYQPGDRVVAAVPAFGPGNVNRIPIDLADGVTNYSVAVWVIRDGRVIRRDGSVGQPTIHGRYPGTLAAVLRELATLPETAAVAISSELPAWVPLGLLSPGLLAGWLAARRFRQRLV